MGNAASDLKKAGDAIVDVGKGAVNIGATVVNTALSPVKAVGSVVGINVPTVPTMSGGAVANLTQAAGNLTQALNPVNIGAKVLPGVVNALPGVINKVAANPMGLVAGAMGGVVAQGATPAVAPNNTSTAQQQQEQNAAQAVQEQVQSNLPLAQTGSTSQVFGGSQVGVGLGGQNSANAGMASGATAGVVAKPSAPIGTGTDPAATAAAVQSAQAMEFAQMGLIAGGALAMILLLKKPTTK